LNLRFPPKIRRSSYRRARTIALALASLAIGVVITGSAGADVAGYTGTLYFTGSGSAVQTGTGTYQLSTTSSGSVTGLNRIAQGYAFGAPPPCGVTTCGYQEFAPGAALTIGAQCAVLAATSCTTPALASTPLSPNGKGWIVDAGGGITFPSGSWTFQVKTQLNNGSCMATCTAHLVIGMWRVSSGVVVEQTLIDPNSGGEDGTNLVNGSGTQTITHTFSGVPGFSLGWGDHIYVQFWRRQIATMNGGNANRQATLFADGTTAITAHPTPTPSVTLSPADGLRTNVIPQLSATFTGPGSGTASMSLELCSDAACGTAVQSTSASASAETASWTPAPPAFDGVYYWRANAQDASAHQSGWTSTNSITLDRTVPTIALSGPANGIRTKSSALSATFDDPDASDSGTVAFRVCSDSACGSVLASGSVSGMAKGATASWTISPSVSDGLRYWQAQSTDVAGNPSAWSASRSFTLDTTPPDTALGSPLPTNPTKVNSASFPFTSEAGATFECDLDGGGWSSCTSPKAYGPLADGDHTFQVRGTDTVGNTNPTPTSYTWTVDTVAPDTTIGPGQPASLSNTAAPSFDLASTESSSTFECSLDSSTFASCSSPKIYTGVRDGSHTLQVRATDRAGNTDGTPASYTWTVDTTPPETTLATPLPANPTTATSADFTFSTEAGASLSCSFDGSTFAPCTSPKSYVALAEGQHTFQVRATDAAGNVDPTPASATWRVDTTAPVTTIDTHPGSRNNERRPTFGFTASESVTGFACSIDGGAFSSCSSPYQPASLADGKHTFRVRATADLAGNAGADVSYTWITDTTPPATPTLGLPTDGAWLAGSPKPTAIYANPDPVDVGTVVFRICRQASGAGSACSDRVAEGTSFITALDGGTVYWAPETPLPEGTYFWQAFAQDDAGNHSGWSATRRFTVDTSAPALPSSTPADGTRTTKAPKLSATFTDATPGDHGSVDFQFCSDESCTAAIGSGSVAVAASGASATWAAPAPLKDGTYFWRLRAEDSVGNSAGWTSSRRLVIDTTEPTLPELAKPAEGAKVRTATLSAGFLDPDLDDLGSVLFRICADPGCRIVTSSGSSAPVANGGTGSWTAPRLRDGSFFWQAAARDAAGNTSGWTLARKLTLDRKAPGAPRLFAGSVVDGTLVLRWQRPLRPTEIASYLLSVDGMPPQEVDADALSVAVGQFDENDTRSFGLQAVDEAGNLSASTRVLVGVPNLVGLTTQQAAAALTSRGLVLARPPKHGLGRQPVVTAQRPAAPAVVARGSSVAVVANTRLALFR
jgi:hypothetical protein